MVPGIAIKSMILFAQSPPPFHASRITHHIPRMFSVPRPINRWWSFAFSGKALTVTIEVLLR